MQEISVRIVGTSNGVLANGYAGLLSKMPRVKVVQNLSIGSSHSCLLPGVAEQFNDQHADVCILDLAVNEQRALSRKLYNFDVTVDLFDYFLGVCEKHNMIPVVLLLPLLNEPNASTEAIRLWTKICTDHGVRFIDALELAAAEWPNVDARTLWRDAAHPDLPFSERLALEIYNASCAALAEQPFIGPYGNHRFMTYRDITGERTSRSTRLTSVDLVVLKEGDQNTIDLGGPARIVGIGLNMAKTNGALEIEGDNKVIKSLSNAFYDSRDFWFVYWNLICPVFSESGIFDLRVVRVEDGMIFEDNDCRARQLPPQDQPVQIELESLIIETL